MWSEWNQPSAVRPGVRSPRVFAAGARARATSPRLMDAPALMSVRTTAPSTTSSVSGAACISSAAISIALARTAEAARRVASPVITVTREANAPMPKSMRSVWPCTTRMQP